LFGESSDVQIEEPVTCGWKLMEMFEGKKEVVGIYILASTG
jgi:hypothetical protein